MTNPSNLPATQPDRTLDRRSDWFLPANLSEAMEWVLMAIIFAMAIFGVANTMLMATFERRYEFALLRALGTTPGAVVRSVLYEAVALGAIALAAGVAITMPVLVGRCFGELHFSKIMGLVMSGFALGILLGIPIAGRIFDRTVGHHEWDRD